ncbi:MAG TPA: site-2 protease family protein [Acidimicrobiales bacterium]|nr:site-2 protease family protein [Acidimicrobiales bacterium]
MNESVRLGWVAGVPVGFNWSVLVIFWLISWSLAGVTFPGSHPGYGESAYWLAGVTTAFVFLISLLAHELGHALTARRLGVEVEGITLWMFGGMAKLGGEAATPSVALRIGVVGPVVSVAAAALYWVLARAVDAAGAGDLVTAVPAWLARINLVLAVFNLVPAFPLDGGRVLQALLWGRSGDRVRATTTAARAGRAFGLGLVGLGVASLAAGSSGNGLWFGFLGWFLLSAARAEESAVVVRDALAGVAVEEVMTPDPVVVPAEATVAAVLEDYALRHRFSAFPLVDGAGSVVGLLTLRGIKRVPADRRAVTAAAAVATPLSRVTVARPGEPVVDLLERLAGAGGDDGDGDGRALVMEDGRLVGIVSPSDVARLVRLAAVRPRPGAAPPVTHH